MSSAEMYTNGRGTFSTALLEGVELMNALQTRSAVFAQLSPGHASGERMTSMRITSRSIAIKPEEDSM
jgi:hypothetical protein